MKDNEQLQKDVQDAIKWEPLLQAAQIGVTVDDGVVTLRGVVDSFAKKGEAENAAKSVAGVRAVVEKIEIRFTSMVGKPTDNEIATEVLNAFKWNWQVPQDKVKVKVEDGWVTLEGDFEFNYQRKAAKTAVEKLMGVKGVSNNTKIKYDASADIEKADIEAAIKRNWSLAYKDIGVCVSGHRATLTGTVDSVYQKDEASRIAWNAMGVWSVDNELVIDYEYDLAD
ncbi:BON domain-containing protein [Parasediminibacterium sp. JCM 36343]|uniref:BON domain-containing protein n=1 Tax=Parasediminibacterium sp. JCM 36343 TaxID=3374279 RepID=UPI00397E0720